MLIDTHAHLQDKRFAPDLARVLGRAEDSGIEYIVCIGERLESSRKGVELARRYPRVAAAVGIHPHHESMFSPRNLPELEALARDPSVVAIGEIGLDFHYAEHDRKRQCEMFSVQGHLAQRRGLPLVVHCRDAYDELIDLMAGDPKIPRKGVIHCFSGTYEHARAFLDLGYYLGIGGALTYPNARPLRETIERIGLDRVVAETDAPYLPPQRKRGRRNEPSYMKHTIKELADLAGVTYQDAARITKANAIRLFGLPAEIEPEMMYASQRSLYVVVTNRCVNDCVFCNRLTDYMRQGHLLKLGHEPTVEELIERIGPTAEYDEIVIGDLGEPTSRWDVTLELARQLKQRGARVRLNTNGMGCLLNKRDIVGEMAGIFDAVSIHMLAHDQETFNRVSATRLPEQAYGAVLDFIERVKEVVPDVIVSVVALPEVDVEATRVLVEEKLGVRLRLREFRPNGYPLVECAR